MTQGICKCGCGAQTKVPNHNDKSKGWVKGVPLDYLKGHNLKSENQKKHLNSLGNKSIKSGGYIVVNKGVRERQYEHILIAEEMLGRKLKYFGQGHPDNEVVHHIDCDKQNNSKENLLVCTHSYHTSLHLRMRHDARRNGN